MGEISSEIENIKRQVKEFRRSRRSPKQAYPSKIRESVVAMALSRHEVADLGMKTDINAAMIRRSVHYSQFKEKKKLRPSKSDVQVLDVMAQGSPASSNSEPFCRNRNVEAKELKFGFGLIFGPRNFSLMLALQSWLR